MNTLTLRWAAMLASVGCLAAGSGVAMAQAAAPVAAPAASAAPAGKPTLRSVSPTDMRDSATPSNDLQSETQAEPQLSIPLGRKPGPVLNLNSRSARRQADTPSGGVSDEAARCDAESDPKVRTACRDKLAHAVKTP